METCRICGINVSRRRRMTLRSAASVGHQPICLRCYGRITETQVRIPRRLREQVEACIAEIVGAGDPA